jgi:hypothetical protein
MHLWNRNYTVKRILLISSENFEVKTENLLSAILKFLDYINIFIDD